MTNSPALTRAEALFIKKEKQRTEGAKAMEDYRRKHENELAKTARLRDLRLQRDGRAARKTERKRGPKAA